MNFVDFARSHGLRLDRPIADGRWHRCATEGKPRKRNGAYILDNKGGAVRDWATMLDFATYREDGDVKRMSQADFRAQRRAAWIDEMRRYATARVEAQRLISECVVAPHEYLSRKGFKDLMACGLVHPSGDLLIPMREFGNYAQINSVQRIAVDGKKLFLTGGKAKNSIFIIGQSIFETWCVEGYATGVTVSLALHDMRRHGRVIVCFSDGNLVHVAKQIKGAFVFADNDASGAGQKAAEVTGLRWVMSSVVGQDANDLGVDKGIRAVVRVMQEVLLEPA